MASQPGASPAASTASRPLPSAMAPAATARPSWARAEEVGDGEPADRHPPVLHNPLGHSGYFRLSPAHPDSPWWPAWGMETCAVLAAVTRASPNSGACRAGWEWATSGSLVPQPPRHPGRSRRSSMRWAYRRRHAALLRIPSMVYSMHGILAAPSAPTPGWLPRQGVAV